MTTLREQAAALPLHPGVYLFKNDQGAVLYVGKANRLRERVRSYFATDIGITRNPGIEQMVREATLIEHELAGSEPEALLLEARLIRRLKPKYNIDLRDDKSFLLIKVEMNHEFPSIGIAREKDLEALLEKKKRPQPTTNRIHQKVDHTEYYGPFPSAYSVRGVLKTIRQIWPFRDCNQTKYNHFAKLGHGCIFASLHLCDAPCAAKISKEDYRQNIDQIRKFLKGEQSSLIKEVETQMEIAAEKEQFEAAAILRNRLYSLQRFQYVIDTFRASKVKLDQEEYDPTQDLRVECYDISNNQGAYAVGSLVCGIIAQGKTQPLATADEVKKRFRFDRTRYRKFKIRTVGGISDTEMLQEVLHRRFKRAGWALPDMVMLDGGKGQLNAVALIRREHNLVEKVALGSVAKGPTRKRTDLHGNDWDRFPLIARDGWHRISELLREEAHRFAISYYRTLHRKGVFK